MSLDEAIALGVKIIKKISEEKLTKDNMDIGYVQDENECVLLSQGELPDYL